MLVAVCPSCGSESVSWRGSYHECKKCKAWHHYNPCFMCGHPETVYHESWARCCDCEWSGDPYDLMEWDNGEPDPNSDLE